MSRRVQTRHERWCKSREERDERSELRGERDERSETRDQKDERSERRGERREIRADLSSRDCARWKN